MMRYYPILLLTALIACTDKNSSVNSTATSESSSQNLFSRAPKLNTRAPIETEQIGQLVGSWNCISKDLVDSTWYENKALWKWEYTLGGHAVLNHWWQEDNSPEAPTKEYFANGIFIFNLKTKAWEAVILNSRPHQISPKFQIEYKDDKIHMHDGTGKWLVTFYDIQENSFEWRYDVKTNSGGWEPISEISAKRMI